MTQTLMHPGETRRIGQHAVSCSNIHDPVVERILDEPVDILYSDPPWGDGNVKFWITTAKKMTGVEYPVHTYQDLLDRLRFLIEVYVKGHVFLETGPRWEAMLADQMTTFLTDVRVFKVLYQGGKGLIPNSLVYGKVRGSPGEMTFDPTNRDGPSLVADCVGSVATPGGIVLDPCCGMGYSARAAVKHGMRFRGNEFNAKRLQKTIDFLSK